MASSLYCCRRATCHSFDCSQDLLGKFSLGMLATAMVRVTFIPKDKDKAKPKSYRPISLT